MDLSPEALRTARFRTGFRGYDTDEVQALLAAVADRVAALEAQLAEAQERAEAAQERAAEVERRADALVAEAEAHAEAIVADGRRRADAELAAAEGQAADRVTAAVAEARAAAEAERDAHLAELTALGDRVAAARGHAAELDRHLDSQEEHLAYLDEELAANRNRLLAVAGAIQALLDDEQALAGLTELAEPEVVAATEPEPVDDELDVGGELAALATGGADPAATFFQEATYVDDRFLSRRERKRMRRDRPAPLGSEDAPVGDAPGATP